MATAAQKELERQRKKQAKTRASGREIVIPRPANTRRRRRALKDFEFFASTYFADIFSQDFTDSRRAMVDAIIHATRHSGDYAVAAPRGSGKTTLALIVVLWLMLRREVRLPLLIGKNQSGTEGEIELLKRLLTTTELLGDDFPEVCVPLIALDNWASRARQQTCRGKSTNVAWQRDFFAFPTIDRKQLPKDWPRREPSVAVGQGFACVGIDGRIRGFRRRGVRPDLAVIDDIDTRESARSAVQTQGLTTAIESDIGGLGESGSRVSRVMLCTCVSTRCVATTYTGRASWRGQRFKLLVKLPEREDLWAEYVDKRCNRDTEDPDARVAHAFYLTNREAMDHGAAVSNPQDFVSKPGADGEPLEVSALQHCYNLIADLGDDAFQTEYQNEPPEDSQNIGSGLDRVAVMQKLSGLERRELPPECTIVIGVDVGKFACHWTVLAVRNQGIATVADYGVAEIRGAEGSDSAEVIQQAILRGLTSFRDDLRLSPFVDEDGQEVPPAKVLVDCGYSQDAVTEFAGRFGQPFAPAKGIGGARFRHGQQSENRIVGRHWFYQQQADRTWMFFLDADRWKQDCHDRFGCDAVDDKGRPTPGSLSLFIPVGRRDHHTFASHIVAEELVSEFTPGRGERQRWVVHSRNNHFLDATALALAAAEICGRGMFSKAPSSAPARSMVISRGRQRTAAW